MTVVIDASVTMAWCFGAEADAYTYAVLDALRSGGAVVPGIWPLEIANVLLLGERRRRITREDADRFLAFLAALPISIAETPTIRHVERLMTLARHHRLTAYDAAYLALAATARVPLATRNRALQAAAEAARIPLFEH